MDKWHGMTMDDIRALEEKTKLELDEERSKVSILKCLIVLNFFNLTISCSPLLQL